MIDCARCPHVEPRVEASLRSAASRGPRLDAGRRQRGFTLVELAVVLVIVGLLTGGGLAAFTAAAEQRLRREQAQQLAQVRSALYGFALRHGRLPCADRDDPPDGVEDYVGPDCAPGADAGALPWATLGVARSDAWGNPLYYSVTARPRGSIADYADAPATGADASFDLSARANRRIADGAGDTIAQEIPAVVVSFGPQGDQVWTRSGFRCPGDGRAPAGFSAAETDNCDGDQDFVDAGYRRRDDSAGRFDDLLTWLPDTVLKSRMVRAGRLP